MVSIFERSKNSAFKSFGLLRFCENSAFIFLIFVLIFRLFQFIGLIVSVFCDFVILSFGLRTEPEKLQALSNYEASNKLPSRTFIHISNLSQKGEDPRVHPKDIHFPRNIY